MSVLFDLKLIHISVEIWGCILSLLMACCLHLIHGVDLKKHRLLIGLECSAAVLLGMDAFAWIYRGGTGMTAYVMVRLSNFLVFLFSDLLMLLYHAYVCSYVCRPETEEKEKDPGFRKKMVYGIGVFAMLLVCLSQFTGWYYFFDSQNVYHRNWLHPLAMLLPLAGLLLDLSLLIQYRRRLRKEVLFSLVSYVVLPILGSVWLIFHYGISLVNLSICVSSVLLFLVALMEQNRILVEKEKELYDIRVTMLLSQIRPHFIYNTLTTIKYLCKTDPEQAAETIDRFAGFLRGNLNSLTDTHRIPFTQEVEHVKNYLAIEKKRFGNRLRVEWDLQENYFLLPPLTLQPVVENAVKHGIMKKVEGGTIRISSRREKDTYEIRVEDDGAGYEESWKTDEKAVHVGIQNTRDRLQKICRGSLELTGIPGKGTKAVIRIPVQTARETAGETEQ